MRHLAAAKAHRQLHLVPIAEEAACVPRFEVQIVLLDLGPKLDLLHLDVVLLLLRLARLAGLFVLELPVVHDPDDRRPGVGRDFHQIETPVRRRGAGLLDRNDSYLLAFRVDQPHRADTDLVVYTGLSFVDYRAPFPSALSARTRNTKRWTKRSSSTPARARTGGSREAQLDPAAPHRRCGPKGGRGPSDRHFPRCGRKSCPKSGNCQWELGGWSWELRVGISGF